MYRYWIEKLSCFRFEGAFDCDSLNVNFKGGNEMICWQALCKRPKRLHYDFLPDFIVRLPAGSITNVNYFSFSGGCRLNFLKPRFNLRIMGTRSDEYKKWFKSICMTSLITRLASYADNSLSSSRAGLDCNADVLTGPVRSNEQQTTSARLCYTSK